MLWPWARCVSWSGGGRVADSTSRGRVPFAVVGVLLLVSASTITATNHSRPTATAEPAAERAVERAESAVVTALRRATRDAAHEAAARPLTEPADTPAGRALAGSDPFRASLELRLAHSFRGRLRHVDTRVGDVRVVARLPTDAGGEATRVRSTLDRVDTAPVGPNATALRATVRNVTLVVTRRGRTLDRIRLSPAVVVGVPVFALHQRLSRFEHRLRRGPLEPGFGRRLTARLYAAAWARGAAQYGGAPVVNVIGTRHVELLANGALLGTQRATLGGVDARATSRLRAATGRVATADVASGIEEGLERDNRTATASLPKSAVERPPTDRRRTVSVGPPAARALSNLTSGGVERVLARTYTATTRTRASLQQRSRTVAGGGRPGPGWSLADRRVEREWSAETGARGVTLPDAQTRWHRLATARRLVVETRTVRSRWVRENRTQETRRTIRTTYAVGLVHEGRPSDETPAPPRPVRDVFDSRASQVGTNLAAAANRSRATFEARTDRLAVRAVQGGPNGTDHVAGRVPDGLPRRVTADLVSLHRRVRNVSVSVESGALATFSVSPARRLATRLRARRGVLVGAPERYDSVAERARYAARAAYVDAVLAALDRQAARHRAAEARLDAALDEAGVGGLDRVRRLAEGRHRGVDTRPPTSAGRFGALRIGVSTAPLYLSTTRASGGTPALATRNLNVAVPYGDAADTAGSVVTETLFGEETVRLATAAGTLQSARRVTDASDDERLADATRRLQGRVDTSVERVSDRLERTLRERGVGRETRRGAVRTALDEWDTPAARALALTNGSVTPRVVTAVASEAPRFRDPARRLALEAALNTTLERVRRTERVRVPERRVDRTDRRLRWVARTTAREATRRAVETGVSRLRDRLRGPLSAVPAGVPVTPVPGYWYATTNVWHVEVRGRYERVTLRARSGRPPTGTLAYVRDGSVVELDVDDDGVPERLGRSEPVSFAVSTAVVVAVPPGPRGVGDKDGNADERSPGWPAPDSATARTNEITYTPPS